jgi:hypothetical protein
MMAQKSFAFQTYNNNGATIQTRTTELRALVDPDMASTVSSHVTHPELHTLLSTMLSTTNLQPSAKAFADMGITQAKAASDFAPDTSPAFQQTVSSVMDKGWKVLNNANIMNGGAPSLPGFSETHGILPTHSLNVPAETPASFAAEVQWAANYFDVMDKLPYAAFWYCMVEFFILRPGIDFYKEDIEADPTGVLADTVAVAGVRVIAIAIISFLTVAFYG